MGEAFTLGQYPGGIWVATKSLVNNVSVRDIFLGKGHIHGKVIYPQNGWQGLGLLCLYGSWAKAIIKEASP